MDLGYLLENWTVDYPVSLPSDEGRFYGIKLKGAKINSNGLEANLGNQWNFDTLIFGCDWIGYFVPFSSTKHFPNDKTVNQLNLVSVEKDIVGAVTGPQAHFIRLYFGWAF